MHVFVYELPTSARLYRIALHVLYCIYCIQMTSALQTRLHGQPKASVCSTGASKHFFSNAVLLFLR